MNIYQNVIQILETHFFGVPVAGSAEELAITIVGMFATLCVFFIPFLCTWWCIKKVLSAFGGL